MMQEEILALREMISEGLITAWENGEIFLHRGIGQRKRVHGDLVDGYLCLSIHWNRKTWRFPFHYIVYMFFNGPVYPGQEVYHEDGLKSNNTKDNLACRNKFDPKPTNRRVVSGGRVINQEIADKIRFLKGQNLQCVADMFNVSRSTISDIWAGRTWNNHANHNVRLPSGNYSGDSKGKKA